MNRIAAEGAFTLPCEYCDHESRGKSEKTAGESLRRHLSIEHNIHLGYDGEDAYRRFHSARMQGTHDGGTLEKLIRPRGAQQNFDAAGVAELLALGIRRPRLSEGRPS